MMFVPINDVPWRPENAFPHFEPLKTLKSLETVDATEKRMGQWREPRSNIWLMIFLSLRDSGSCFIAPYENFPVLNKVIDSGKKA